MPGAAEEKQEKSEEELLVNTLKNAGFSEEEIKKWKNMDPEDKSRMLFEKYDSQLGGRRLGALLRLIRSEAVPEMAADFYVQVLEGPAVPAQLLVIRTADRPEWRKFEKVEKALQDYQNGFDSLTEAYSVYEDKYTCGCDVRGRGYL